MKPLLLALLLALPVGCASFHMTTQPGFAELEGNDDHAYRATSADGVVIAVRSERNRPEGNLDFWSGAIDERLRGNGYVLDGDPRPVQSADGVGGVQRRYARDANGRTLRFWTTVFVKGSRVFVVEAGGDREVFDRAAPAVERAIASITL
jgi:hypothetical protein